MVDEQEGQREEDDLPNNDRSEFIDVQEVEQRFSVSATIPSLLTSFVGRERELEMARTLLLRSDVRLVTFLGAGGVGKTRLAMVVVNELHTQFVDGIYFIPFAPLTDSSQVLPTIVQTLGIPNDPNKPFLDLLIETFHNWHALLLLDNFERVIEAAPALIELLKACPFLKILVTSRTVLHVQGEYEFVIPPLRVPYLHSLPSNDQLIQYSAIALFVQRAQAVKRDFTLTDQNAAIVAELCIRLDGLPLAIELAVPRLKLLSPSQLLKRLENLLLLLTHGSSDLHERQQTLRDTIKWSYDILTTNEKKLFRRLSIFRGGFTIEAVENICQLNNDLTIEVLDLLNALLNKSLIYQSEEIGTDPHLMMMETIRDFSLECLITNGEEESMKRQSADYYLDWMEATELQLYGSEQMIVLNRAEREVENMRSALQWFVQYEQVEATLRLVNATGRFWFLRSYLAIPEYLSQWQYFFELALPFLEKKTFPLQLRAKFLLNYGILHSFLDTIPHAEMLGKESLELFKQLQAPEGLIRSYWLLAYCAQKRTAYEEARMLNEEALLLATHLKSDFARALSLRCVAQLAFFTGDYARAIGLLEECLFFVQKIDDTILWVLALRHLAEIYYAQGDYIRARSFCEESLLKSRHSAMKRNTAWSQTLLASILWRQGEMEDAFHFMESAYAEHTKLNCAQGVVWTMLWLARIAAHNQQMPLAQQLSEKVLMQIKSESDRWYIAIFLELLADVAVFLQEIRWAVRLWGKANILREDIHAPLPPVEQEDYELARIGVQKLLGEATFSALWVEGRRLDVEQVIDFRNKPIKLDISESLPEGLGSLTRRELEVLRLLAAGQSNTQIAEQLTISRVTVNSYLRSIYSKLEVSSRTAAMRYAIDHHFL